MKAGNISPATEPIQPIGGIRMQGNDSYADAKMGSFQMYLAANAGKGQETDFDLISAVKPAKDLKTGDDGKTDAFNSVKENTVNDKTAGKTADKKEAKTTDKTDKADGKVKKTDVKAGSEAEAKIKETVKEELGLTDEELEAVLAQLGFGIADLLVPQNVAVLVAAVNDTDVTSIVADAELTEQLTKLTAAINTVVTQVTERFAMNPKQLEQAVREFETQDALSESAVDLKPENTDAADHTPEQAVIGEKAAAAQPEYVVVKDENTGREIKVTVENDKVIDSEASVQYTKAPEKPETPEQGHQDRKENSKGSRNDNGFAQNIVQNLTQAVIDSTDGVASFTENYTVNTADVIRQVIEAIRVNVNADTSSMEVQLNPESLGRIHLNVAAKDGVVTATITAQNEAVKGIIESQLIQLKESLNNQGLKVQNVEVAVAAHGFDLADNGAGQEQNSGHKSSRRYRGVDEIADDDGDMQEILEQKIMEANGNSVSYTA